MYANVRVKCCQCALRIDLTLMQVYSSNAQFWKYITKTINSDFFIPCPTILEAFFDPLQKYNYFI